MKLLSGCRKKSGGSDSDSEKQSPKNDSSAETLEEFLCQDLQ